MPPRLLTAPVLVFVSEIVVICLFVYCFVAKVQAAAASSIVVEVVAEVGKLVLGCSC